MERLREELLGLVPEDVAEAAAHPEEVAVRTDVGEADRGVVGRHAVALLALQEPQAHSTPVRGDTPVHDPPERKDRHEQERECPRDVPQNAKHPEGEQCEGEYRRRAGENPRGAHPALRRVHGPHPSRRDCTWRRSVRTARIRLNPGKP